MNKLVALAILVFSLQSPAAIRVIGNGGDAVEDNPISVALLQNYLSDSKLFIVSWLHGLERRMNSKFGPGKFVIPKGSDKLLTQKPGAVYSNIERLVVQFRSNAACESKSGDSDGSVASENPPVICISGFNLAKKLNEGNAKVQLDALILHEVSHLLGTTEEEAKAIQEQYIQDMRFVSKYSILKRYRESGEAVLGFNRYVAFQMLQSADDGSKLCELIRESYQTLLSAFSFDNQDPIDVFEERGSKNGAALLKSLDILKLHVCGKNPSNPKPDWVKEYESGFADKKVVTLLEWDKNSGEKYPGAYLPFRLKKVENKDDLFNEIINLGAFAGIIGNQITRDTMIPFEVEINDAKK